jgi:PilZ domain
MQPAISRYDNVLCAEEAVSGLECYCGMVAPLELNDTMRSDGLRQSDRVRFRMPVEVSWTDGKGASAKYIAETLLVSRNGGVLRLDEKLVMGQEITLRRMEGDLVRTARARVMAEIDQEPDGFLYAIHIVEPRVDFWDIDFPAPHKAEEALARLLMECGFCQRREVVYLNELELKSFEVRKCVARHCKHCDTPSIWIEAQAELKGSDAGGTRPQAIEERVVPRRNRTRVKARVLACIRKRGFQEEVAVCEDLSKGGLSFRSRNQYPEGSRVEVAVPYTPGSGAIFVPIRIVFSQAIPTAGLYRHGAAYIRPPQDSAD